VTGFSNVEASIVGKWLAMLKEIAPSLTSIGFLANPKTGPYDYFLRAGQAAARSLAIELVSIPVESTADTIESIESFARVPNGGLLLPPDTTNSAHRDLIIALAGRHRLPAVYATRIWVTSGGLMCYEADIANQFRQAATYVDRILRGEMPAELPVQTPVKYRTVVNLKTAKALGLTVPLGLLVAADEVIE
jgi:putative ABC transport system substrate-binding protein